MNVKSDRRTSAHFDFSAIGYHRPRPATLSSQASQDVSIQIIVWCSYRYNASIQGARKSRRLHSRKIWLT